MRRRAAGACEARAGSDPLADWIDTVSRSPEPLASILAGGLHAFAYDFAGIERGGSLLVARAQAGSLTAFDTAGVHHEPGGLTPLLRDLLRRLARGPASKQDLVETVWGYRCYSPLRHDPMVYSAMSSLRRLLGPFHAWIRVTEAGYALMPGLVVHGIDGVQAVADGAKAPAE
jgi:hypothetical protein